MKITIGLALLVAVAASLMAGCTTDYPGLASIERTSGVLSVSAKGLSEPPQQEVTNASFSSAAEATRQPVFKTLTANEDIMDHIKGAPGVVLIDFYADWCGPCRKQSSILHDLKDNAAKKKASIIKVNVDDHAELASLFKISALPTLILIKDKKIIEREMGLASQTKIEAFLSR